MIHWEKQKKIKTLYELYSRPVRTKYGLTQMEYSILMFLHRDPACDTASLIVQTNQFTKSHVSSAVKELEERRLVTREYQDNNKKTIHLKLTDEAQVIVQEAVVLRERYMETLFTGFSDEERQQIKSFFERICGNAEAELQKLADGESDKGSK